MNIVRENIIDADVNLALLDRSASFQLLHQGNILLYDICYPHGTTRQIFGQMLEQLYQISLSMIVLQAELGIMVSSATIK